MKGSHIHLRQSERPSLPAKGQKWSNYSRPEDQTSKEKFFEIFKGTVYAYNKARDPQFQQNVKNTTVRTAHAARDFGVGVRFLGYFLGV